MRAAIIPALIFGLIFAYAAPAAAQQSPAPTDSTVPVDGGALAKLLEALIIEKGADIVAQNIKASERESGDLDKAVRATFGISILDIKKYGLLGGPNF
jgi:hypothetical protein